MVFHIAVLVPDWPAHLRTRSDSTRFNKYAPGYNIFFSVVSRLTTRPLFWTAQGSLANALLSMEGCGIGVNHKVFKPFLFSMTGDDSSEVQICDKC